MTDLAGDQQDTSNQFRLDIAPWLPVRIQMRAQRSTRGSGALSPTSLRTHEILLLLQIHFCQEKGEEGVHWNTPQNPILNLKNPRYFCLPSSNSSPSYSTQKKIYFNSKEMKGLFSSWEARYNVSNSISHIFFLWDLEMKPKYPLCLHS